MSGTLCGSAIEAPRVMPGRLEGVEDAVDAFER
jgi:hypothetical protein